jgi:hypothetical protein
MALFASRIHCSIYVLLWFCCPNIRDIHGFFTKYTMWESNHGRSLENPFIL